MTLAIVSTMPDIRGIAGNPGIDMAKRMFSVAAHWDDDAKVYYSESDITGLHIEARTIEEFEEAMMDVAPTLVMTNHVSKDDLENLPPQDLIPAILWHRPADKAA